MRREHWARVVVGHAVRDGNDTRAIDQYGPHKMTPLVTAMFATPTAKRTSCILHLTSLSTEWKVHPRFSART